MLDDNGIRPPIIAAGINLFGGPLGLLHRHVTGAIPIRRNTKDPAYLITLKAYVAELLQRHDLFFYPEGGRSYSGELKTPEDRTDSRRAAGRVARISSSCPAAIAYDLVLEDHVLARQGVKRQQRPFTRELAEMVRYAVGYRSRAFVTFGAPISTAGLDPQSRRDVLELAHQDRAPRSAALYKVLPDGAGRRRRCGRRSAATRSRAAGSTVLIDTLRARRRQPGRRERRRQARRRRRPSRSNPRHHRRRTRPRLRVRERSVLRYYARTIEHLLQARRRT